MMDVNQRWKSKDCASYRSGRVQPPSINSGLPGLPQLTIFYAGTVNVYDNVANDEAQAIKLLAGESSRAATARRVPSVREVRADVPMARKQSLNRFLERRRDRIVNVAPYFSIKKGVEEATTTNCLGVFCFYPPLSTGME
ncbi:protein TIFY 3-like [Aristolochia californica]|uniref:protein TIFY 3-like n=1 Tax=Aristolochia californica TaxID=171875 RepID=UPI0035DE9264